MKYQFFVPFVGTKYNEGINGKKILVVGASFYCNKKSCMYFSACTNVQIKDSSPFDKICPYYIKEKMQLHNEPAYCVENAPSTYQTFETYIAELLNNCNYDEAWNHLAFTNYVQFFLPCNSGKYRETKFSDLSERDYLAFNETITKLQPEIVIIWGCTINSRLKENNKYVYDKERLKETQGYICHFRLPHVNHEITLINPYHPSSKAWTQNLTVFDKYLKEELNL